MNSSSSAKNPSKDLNVPLLFSFIFPSCIYRLSPSADPSTHLQRQPHFLKSGIRKKMKKLAEESYDFGISDLPNDMLEHILSFLSLREVMKMCLLSKNWRHIWKYVPTVCISETVEECNKLLGNFLLARSNMTINVCNIELTGPESIGMHDMMHKWIFHVVMMCHVRELIVIIRVEDNFLWLNDEAIISKHLKRLELDRVHLHANTVDFSRCPMLEEIDLTFCCIEAKIIKSQSLNRLIANECEFIGVGTRTHISVPSLVFLKLIDICHYTPLLEDMPSLEVGHIRLGNNCTDSKYNIYWGKYGISFMNDEKNDSILLQGLSNATRLELLSEPGMLIFERDFIRCPTFRNLRILILNQCFLDANLHGLVCILDKSPCLEELNLILLEEPKQVVESNGGHYKMEHHLLMKSLKGVKVICERKYTWVNKIISSLITFGIPPEKIIVEENGCVEMSII